MRILHVNKYVFRGGGSDAYAQDVAALQRAEGHEVEFFGMQHPDNVPCRYAEHFPSYVSLDPPPPTATGKLQTGARMVWSRSAATGMRAVVDDFRPDIVHHHGIYHQLSPSILRPIARRRVPMVMTLHDYKLACPTYRFLDKGEVCEACVGRKFHNAVLRRCRDGSLTSSTMMAVELSIHTWLGAYRPVDLFLCPSRFLAGKMTEARVFPDRLRHLPNFADIAALKTKHGTGGPVLYAGRLSSEKGVDVLIRAAADLAAGINVEIAGSGPEEEALRRLADEVAPGRVEFLGWLAKDDLANHLRDAAMLVLPARWHENQPISILEALGTGVPVITTTLGGAAEVVEHGVDGLLVAPDDPIALRDAIATLAGAPERAAEMGRIGRAKVEVEFAPATHLRRLHDLYTEAAEVARAR